MSEDIRKMIDKVKNIKQFVNENKNKMRNQKTKWHRTQQSGILYGKKNNKFTK